MFRQLIMVPHVVRVRDPEPTNSPSTTVERGGLPFLLLPLRLAGAPLRWAGLPLADFPLPGFGIDKPELLDNHTDFAAPLAVFVLHCSNFNVLDVDRSAFGVVLRREELLWLTPDDIDWTADNSGLIRIRAKTVQGEKWQPKTKKNRGVPVSSRLRTYLDKRRLKHHGGRWLFPNSEGNRQDADNFSRDLRMQTPLTELTHTNLIYRHSFGSQLAMKGESLYKIAALMGNSPAIAARHYAALLPESLVNSVEFGLALSG